MFQSVYTPTNNPINAIIVSTPGTTPVKTPVNTLFTLVNTPLLTGKD